jgi:hypothetical protein
VPFEQYLKSIAAQTIKSVMVTRWNVHQAFADLVITPEVFNEIGPAINWLPEICNWRVYWPRH